MGNVLSFVALQLQTSPLVLCYRCKGFFFHLLTWTSGHFRKYFWCARLRVPAVHSDSSLLQGRCKSGFLFIVLWCIIQNYSFCMTRKFFLYDKRIACIRVARKLALLITCDSSPQKVQKKDIAKWPENNGGNTLHRKPIKISDPFYNEVLDYHAQLHPFIHQKVSTCHVGFSVYQVR